MVNTGFQEESKQSKSFVNRFDKKNPKQMQTAKVLIYILMLRRLDGLYGPGLIPNYVFIHTSKKWIDFTWRRILVFDFQGQLIWVQKSFTCRERQMEATNVTCVYSLKVTDVRACHMSSLTIVSQPAALRTIPLLVPQSLSHLVHISSSWTFCFASCSVTCSFSCSSYFFMLS